MDVLVDVAEDHPAALLAGQPVQGQESTQRRRAGEDHAIQVNDKVGLSLGPDVGLVMLAQVADRIGVESQAIPELGNEDAALVPDLDHGLEHENSVRSCENGTERTPQSFRRGGISGTGDFRRRGHFGRQSEAARGSRPSDPIHDHRRELAGILVEPLS